MPSVVDPRCGPLPTEQTTNGCFETMRAYGGRIFRLEPHLDRLFGSARYLGLASALSRPRLRASLRRALATSTLREAVVRVAIMPVRADGGRLTPRQVRVLPSIVVQPVQPPTEAAYADGISVAMVPTKKFPVSVIDPQTKYSARLSSVMAVMEAQLRGVDEALFLDALGSVTESTASNFGIIRDGALLTPPCWLGLLAGITRDVLLEAAGALKLRVHEAPLTRHEVYAAQEAFLTSTLKEVLAVTRVDGRRIGEGAPGPITVALRREFQRIVRRELRLPGRRDR